MVDITWRLRDFCR